MRPISIAMVMHAYGETVSGKLTGDGAANAARTFYAGYQNSPKGQRAHNSLLWLAKALLETKGPKSAKAACDTLDQLSKSFPDRLTGQFAADAAATRAQAKCTP